MALHTSIFRRCDRNGPPPNITWPGLALFVLILTLLGCGPPAEVSRGVRLMLAGDTLEPAATFELRFDELVVNDSEIGQVAKVSPLILKPTVTGQFVWLSQRSGVFTPTAPFELATTYQLSLRPGFRKPDGTVLNAQLHRRFKTPAFTGESTGYDRFNPTNAPSLPQFELSFNANVEAKTVEYFACFRNADGARIAARVEQGIVPGFYNPEFSSGGVESQLTWKQRFVVAQAKSAQRPSRLDRLAQSVQKEQPYPIPNRVLISPVKPLPVGQKWQLVVDKGLPAAERPLRLSEALNFPVGNVLPFTLLSGSAHNTVEGGRRFRLSFSRPISSAVTGTNFEQWIKLSPAPPNLACRFYGRQLELTGDYLLSQSYTVRVNAKFPAADGMVLEKVYTNQFAFTPMPPRLYFPSFSTDQLGVGHRTIELLSLNVSNVQVRAKLLDRHTLIHALRGYQSYFGDSTHVAGYEPYREVDFNVLSGRTIYQTNFHVEVDIDDPEKIKLQWDEILGTAKMGPVFLAADRSLAEGESRKILGTETLIQVTDLGMIWKTAPHARWVHVFSYQTAKPVTNATVSLMTEENEVLCERTTDSQGIAEFPLLDKGQWLLAEKEGDLRAVRLNEHWGQQLPIYGLNGNFNWNQNENRSHRVFMFSDRPVYRPGETLYLKAIVRDWEENHLVIPEDLQASLQCYDVRDRKFFETNLVFSELGSVDAAVILPLGALGGYRAELVFDPDETQVHYFQVQEFRPNAFEISLPNRKYYPIGENINIPISARYYFGKALTKAKLRWAIEANDTGFSPEGLEDFHFTANGVGPEEMGYHESAVALHGEETYAGKEPLVLQPKITLNPKAPQPRQATLLVEMTDLNQQTISRSMEFILHSSDFYLGIKAFKDVVRAGEAVPVQLVAVKPDGTPYTTPVKVQVRCQKMEWQAVRVQGAGGAITYRNQFIMTNLVEREITTQSLKRVGIKWALESEINNLGLAAVETTATNTPAPGPGSQPTGLFVLPEAGTYLIEARTQDAGGHEVVTALTCYAAGKQDLAWNYRNEGQIELVPDQKQYLAGQTASILIKTPIDGSALVTIEREQVLRGFVTNLTGHAPTVQVPILESDAPNVFVSVILLRGATNSTHQVKAPEYRLGYCPLEVEKPQSHLTVNIRPDRPDYQPGQQVTLMAAVQDSIHRPVTNAEVTLFAVDEGILSLMEYSVPDPQAFFYMSQPLGISTYCSLLNLLPEDPGQFNFGNKGYLVGGGGKAGERLRKNFVPCAFWRATLQTDQEGLIKVSFLAPDSVSRYRVMAVVQTANHQFGHGTSAFETKKPLLVEPALPLFAHVTDQILARAVIHNQSDYGGELEATLELDGRALARPATNQAVTLVTGNNATNWVISQRLSIASGSSGVVEFPVQFSTVGLAQWTWRARFLSTSAPVFKDAVQSQLKVDYITPLLHEVYLGRSKSLETNLLAQANPQLLAGQGTITVRIANTRLAELNEANQQLLHYPYGCIEQTCSSLLPWLTLSGHSNVFPELGKSPVEVRQVVQRGINRILSMQTPSGGLSFWPGERQPMLWASAYGGMTLWLAQQQGYPLPEVSLGQIINYLKESLRLCSDLLDNYDLSDRCFALYTLALIGQSETSYHEILYQKRARLSVESRAMLALAILASRGAPSMVEELLNSKSPLPLQGDLWFSCGARELAVRLLAWCRYRPSDNQVDVLVEELMREARSANWTTTQGNAWALLSLAEYATQVEQNKQPAHGAISWANDNHSFNLGEQSPVSEVTMTTVPERALAPLLLTNPLQRLLFTETKLQGRPKVAQQPRQDRGFALQRNYWLVLDDGTLKKFEQARVGDRVLVILRLEVGQTAHFVVVDDPLPGILEAIHPEFKSQQTQGGDELTTDWVSDYRELRSDRALFFRDHLPPGHYIIRYLARVRASGTVTAPAAKIEEMYHPDRFGLTDTISLNSLPME